MIEFDSEVQVRGRYTDEPVVVKVGNVLACLASIDLLIFIPILVGAAVVGGVGTPASSRSGRYGSFIFLAAMLFIGAWVNYMWLGWLSGDRISRVGRWLFLSFVGLLSVGASALAVLFHVWQATFLCFAAFVPAGLLTYWMLVKIRRDKSGCRRSGH